MSVRKVNTGRHAARKSGASNRGRALTQVSSAKTVVDREVAGKSASVRSNNSKKQLLFVRVCHKCGHWHEQENGRVEACDSCGVCFAPYFFFNELHVAMLKDNARVVRRKKSKMGRIDASGAIGFKYDPLRGLSAVWEISAQDS